MDKDEFDELVLKLDRLLLMEGKNENVIEQSPGHWFEQLQKVKASLIKKAGKAQCQ